jgi:hypothetical protein
MGPVTRKVRLNDTGPDDAILDHARLDDARRACALNPSSDASKRSAFFSVELTELTAETKLIVAPFSDRVREFRLTSPSVKVDPLRRPVRGDLAHIRCAGTVFVPHYVVPMPRTIAAGGAELHLAANPASGVLASLGGGSAFQVLDISGGWVWGQVGLAEDEDGFVGYLPLTALA